MKTLGLTKEELRDNLEHVSFDGVYEQSLNRVRCGGRLNLIDHVKNLDGPIVIHAITQKGKGYAFAEEDSYKYHGVTP